MLRFHFVCIFLFSVLVQTQGQEDTVSPYSGQDVEVVVNVDGRYNEDVEAKIELSESNALITVKAIATNKTDFSQNLKYVFTFIQNDGNGNTNRDSKEDLVVVNPLARKELGSGGLYMSQRKGSIVLLLIYKDDKLIGKDRVAFDELEDDYFIKNRNLLSQEGTGSDDFEIRGIVTEDTKTKAGRDFYRLFYQKYTYDKINGSKVVAIKENFGLGISTIIKVYVDNNLVWQFNAQPKEDLLKKMRDISIVRVSNYFSALKKQGQQLQSY